jgi:hypothetical protein
MRSKLASIRAARPPQQRFWMTLQLPDEYIATFVDGDCGSIVPNEQCRFVHPWLAEDVDLSSLKLTNQLDDSNDRFRRSGAIIIVTLFTLLFAFGKAVLAIVSMVQHHIEKKKKE